MYIHSYVIPVFRLRRMMGGGGYVLFVLVLVNSYFWVALFYAAVSTGPPAVVNLTTEVEYL